MSCEEEVVLNGMLNFIESRCYIEKRTSALD